ncbi:MAG: TetR/AcrR family transcriptional regulator, partial [Verrucomicrobiota bacterium]
VGINEIIEKSETAKATFYNHFPSKEALCAAWLGDTHDRSEIFHDKLAKEDKDPLQKVRDYFLSLKDWMRNNTYQGCPYSNTAANESGNTPLIQEKITEHKVFQKDFFLGLAHSFAQGVEARKLGHALFLLYSGATTEARNLKASWPIEEAAETATALCKAAANS